jgi:hypothetical protein
MELDKCLQQRKQGMNMNSGVAKLLENVLLAEQGDQALALALRRYNCRENKTCILEPGSMY